VQARACEARLASSSSLRHSSSEMRGNIAWGGVYTGEKTAQCLPQGILKGEVSLYHWPPVWLVWNQLYDNWQFLF
jgi:hypothetical protein